MKRSFLMLMAISIVVTVGFALTLKDYYQDPKIAVQRALTEVNQILPAVLSANADGSTDYRSYEPLAIGWWKTATLENQPYLVPDESVAAKVYADYPHVDHKPDIVEKAVALQELLPKETVQKILWDNAVRFYGLESEKPRIGDKSN